VEGGGNGWEAEELSYVSRRVLELGLADSRMGGGGDDCRAAAEAGRRADIALVLAAQHSTAGTGFRDGTS
jgi:hypothetical protein